MLSKILKLFPTFPRYLTNIFVGTFKCNEIELIKRYLFNRDLNLNSSRLEYEKLFAEKVAQKYAVSFQAGRHALFAALKSLELSESDEVIIPAYTCVVVPNAIIYTGLKPVYVDIDSRDLNINVDLIESKITPKTKILYAQHTYGIPCNMEKLKKLAERYNLFIIEDGAHSIGLSCKTRGDISFYSTDHSKIINTMIGGVVTTNSEAIYERLIRIQSSANELKENQIRSVVWSLWIEQVCFHPNWLWLLNPVVAVLDKLNCFFTFKDELLTTKPDANNYLLKMSPILCEIGKSQLNDLENNLSHRRKIFSILNSSKYGNDRLNLEINKLAPLRFTFMLREDKKVIFFKLIRKYFIDLGIWFTSVVHGRNENLIEVHYQAGSCPIAERVVKENINIPTHFYVTEKVAHEIKEILDRL